MIQSGKYWYESKTIWLNAISFAIIVVTSATQQDWLKANPNLVATAAGVLTFLNLVLRFVTTMPIVAAPEEP